MTVLLVSVIAASLLGSLHCAGMCGAFAAIAMSPGAPRSDASVGAGRLALQSGYHGGRLVAYVGMGVAAGTAGALLDLSGVLTGLSSIAAVLAGVTLMAFGAIELARYFGARTGRIGPLPRPALLSRLVSRAVRTSRPLSRSIAMGAASGLLPCGWLYAFVVAAAGTGGTVEGGLVMAAFWIGTVPILATVGLSADGLRRVLGPKAPLVASVVVLLLGMATLVGRLDLDVHELTQRVDAAAHDRGAGSDLVPDASQEPACCSES